MKTDITWTDGAWERFKDVQSDIAQIRAYFGDAIADEHEAEFLRCFNRVTLAAGPVNVYTESSDSFLIVTPFITIGLIWFPDDDAKRKQRLASKAGFHYDNESTSGWPTTGTWSTHS